MELGTCIRRLARTILAAFLSLIVIAANACDDSTLQFVCGSNGCDKATFREGLEFRSEQLGGKDDASACFVEPQRKATNFFTGFFVVKGDTAAMQFVFFGSGIATTKKIRRGYRLVVGSEIVDHETVRHVFEWNGKAYVETASKTLKW